MLLDARSRSVQVFGVQYWWGMHRFLGLRSLAAIARWRKNSTYGISFISDAWRPRAIRRGGEASS
jgi:hypothetical protein